MQLADLTRSFRRHWRASVVVLLLTGALLALFVATRNETRPSNRWESSVRLLVPAIERQGRAPRRCPARTPPEPRADCAVDEVKRAALDSAGVEPTTTVSFKFTTSENREIVTLSASAPEEATAVALAEAYARAYTEARGQIVSDGAESTRESRLSTIDQYRERLAEVNARTPRDRLGLVSVSPPPARTC